MSTHRTRAHPLGSPWTGWRLALTFIAVLLLLSLAPRSACGGPTTSLPLNAYLTNPWVLGAEVAAAVAVPVAVHDDPGDTGAPNGWEAGDDPAPHPQISGAVLYPLPRLTHGEEPSWCRLKSSHAATDGKTTAYLVFLEELSIYPTPQYVAQPLLGSTYDSAGMEALLIPMLVNLSSDADLFVAVDLNAWLAAPPTLAVGDVVPVSSGDSKDLPGFLVATEDISLDALTGFQSASPFSGDVGVGGFYGLQVMPEPATLGLLAAGALGLTFWRRHG